MIEPRSFSHLKSFPGIHGNPFDVILHRLERIQKIPVFFVFIILATLSLLCAQLSSALTAIMLAFFLLDWGLLAILPLAGRSFGPEKAVLFLLAILRTPFALLPLPVNLVFQTIGTLLVIYAFWIEPFRLKITRQELVTSKIQSDTHLQLLHLGDLHIERLTRREHAILNAVEKARPDLILFSGDILNLSYLADPKALQDAREFLSRLHAPLGVYLVSGSPAVDLPDLLPRLLEDLPLQWLQNESVLLPLGDQQLCLIGLTCTHRPYRDAPILQALSSKSSAEIFTILLYHSPDLAPHAAQQHIDLQLSGHTHGGQFRLPWLGALFTGSLYGRVFQSGRYQLEKLTLYITRGIGLEGAAAPRMRFLCPPEIIFWDIHSAKSNQGV
ncbi:MAG TPA: metallophosphoesterase [Anaerolineaceae bacterium]|nr:metallophosphoesterase [Anaerolineaceae bacterium]